MKSPTPEALKSWRKKHGLRQKDAASQASVSLRTWQAYEAGETSCPASTWELLLIKSGEMQVSLKPEQEMDQ